MKGNILIASPNLLFDSFFSKTIILIVDQTKDGYNGFILNKALELKIKEVKEFTKYSGGPVSNENLYFIYKTMFKAHVRKSAIRVVDILRYFF